MEYKDVIRKNPCSSILCIGGRRSGKTELCRSFFIEEGLIGDWADITIIFCQTINREAYISAGADPKYIYHEYRDDVVEAIIEMQEKMKRETGKMLNIWLICDDILSSRKNKSKAINGERGIEFLYSVCRHYNINCTTLTQTMKYVGLYQNADMVFIFPHHIRKKSDKELFVKEILSNYTDDEDVFYKCKPHQFLFLHLTAETDKFEELHDVNMVSSKIIKFKI